MSEIMNFDTDAQYTHEYSSVPQQVMEMTIYKDVDDSVSELVNNIKKARADVQEPEAESLGDVWIDVDHTVESPEKNDDLVQERNKTAEDYEADIQQLKDTYSAKEDIRN